MALVRAAISGFRPFVKGKLLVDLVPAVDEDAVMSRENAARFRTWLGS